MPGPKSNPKAKLPNGQIVRGKTALRHLGLHSGQGMNVHDFARDAKNDKQDKRHEKGNREQED